MNKSEDKLYGEITRAIDIIIDGLLDPDADIFGCARIALKYIKNAAQIREKELEGK